MNAHTLAELIEQGVRSGRAYHEFLRVPAMSAGIYRLPEGGNDLQSPHREDELYWVLDGRATVRVADEDRRVEPGDSVFVAAGVAHRFHSITEDLVVLVVFAPAETAS
jgi:mannose-6-phosphate isomerase-like protein (cupin superfamily)